MTAVVHERPDVSDDSIAAWARDTSSSHVRAMSLAGCRPSVSGERAGVSSTIRWRSRSSRKTMRGSRSARRQGAP